MEIAPSAVDAGEQVRLDRIGTTQIFSPASSSNESIIGNSLVICSGTYGLIFVASNYDIKAIFTEQLAAHFSTGSDLTSIIANVPHPVQAVCLNSDESLLAVVTHSNTHGSFVYLYEIGIFNPTLNRPPRPFTDIRLTAAGEQYIVDFQFNPVTPNSFACISSTGGLTIRELLADGSVGYRITADLPTANAGAISWSPKGKQLCCIMRDNSAIIQVKPDGGIARRIELPSNGLSRDPAAAHLSKKIIWLSTYEFILNTHVNPSDLQPSLLHVIAPKVDAQFRMLNYHDVCYGADDMPHALWYYTLLSQWGLLLATSSASIEVAVLRNETNFAGGGVESAARWQQLTPDDTCRAELPFGDEQNSAGVPCGLAVDYSNSMTNNGTEPYVLWLTTSGALHVYKLMYRPTDLLAPAGLQQVPSLRNGPVQQSLPPISVRQQQVLTAAVVAPPPVPNTQQPAASSMPSFSAFGGGSVLPVGGNPNLFSGISQQNDQNNNKPAPVPFSFAPASTAEQQQPLFSAASSNSGGFSTSTVPPIESQPSTFGKNFAAAVPPTFSKPAKSIETQLVALTSGPETPSPRETTQNTSNLTNELNKIMTIVDKFDKEFRAITNVIANESIFADAEQASAAFGTKQLQPQASLTYSIAELYKLIKPFDGMLTINDKRLRNIGDRVVQHAADVDAVLAQLDVWLIALKAQASYGGNMFAQLLRQQPPSSQFGELRQHRFAALQRAFASYDNVLSRLHGELDNAFALYGLMNYNDSSNPVLSLSGQPLPPGACRQLKHRTSRALSVHNLLQRVVSTRKAVTNALEMCARISSHAATVVDDTEPTSPPHATKSSHSEVLRQARRREWLAMLNEYRLLVIQAREKLHATAALSSENGSVEDLKSRNSSSGGMEKLASRLSKLDFGGSTHSLRKPRTSPRNQKSNMQLQQKPSRPAWLVQLLRARINDEDCSTVPCAYADEKSTALVDAYKQTLAATAAGAADATSKTSSNAAANENEEAELNQLTRSMSRLCELQETLVRSIQEAALMPSNNSVASKLPTTSSRVGLTLQPTSATNNALFSTPSSKSQATTTPNVDVQALSNLLAIQRMQQQQALKTAAATATPKITANSVASVFGALDDTNGSSKAQNMGGKVTTPKLTSAAPSIFTPVTTKSNTNDEAKNAEASFTIKRSSPLLSSNTTPLRTPNFATPNAAPTNSSLTPNTPNNTAFGGGTASPSIIPPQTAVMKTAEPLQGDATKSPFFGGFSAAAAAAPVSFANTTDRHVTFDGSTGFGGASSTTSLFGAQPPPSAAAAVVTNTSNSFRSGGSVSATINNSAQQQQTNALSSSPFGALLGFKLGGDANAAVANSMPTTTAASLFSTPTTSTTSMLPPAAATPSPFSSFSNSTTNTTAGGLFGSSPFATSTPLFGSAQTTTTNSTLFGNPTSTTTATAAMPSFSLSGLAAGFGKPFSISSNESQTAAVAPAATTTSSSLFGAGSFFAGGAAGGTSNSSPFSAPATSAAPVNPFNMNSVAPAFGSTPSLFGGGFSSGGGGFGSKPAFGGGGSGLFGATLAPTSNVFGTSSAFGGADGAKTTGPSFADVAAQAQQQPTQSSVFGSGTASFAPFGSTPSGASTGFGSTGGLFGSGSTATGGGLFGTPSSAFGATSGSSIFGQSTTAKVDAAATPFGAAQPHPSFSQYRG